MAFLKVVRQPRTDAALRGHRNAGLQAKRDTAIDLRLVWLLLSILLLTATASGAEWTVRMDTARKLMQEGNYRLAEKELRTALGQTARLEQAGDEHGDALLLLGTVYRELGRLEQAEYCYRRAIQIFGDGGGEPSPAFVQAVGHLASLYVSTHRYRKAEQLPLVRLVNQLRASGSNTTGLAGILATLGAVKYASRRFAEAEALLIRSLELWNISVGPQHADYAACLHNLGYVYLSQARYMDALRSFERALGIVERAVGPDHPDVAQGLLSLAEVRVAMGQYEGASLLYQRAVRTIESKLGRDHSAIPTILAACADALEKLNRSSEARRLRDRAKNLRVEFGHGKTSGHTMDTSEFRKNR